MLRTLYLLWFMVFMFFMVLWFYGFMVLDIDLYLRSIATILARGEASARVTFTTRLRLFHKTTFGITSRHCIISGVKKI
jgi:hypothetical protein